MHCTKTMCTFVIDIDSLTLVFDNIQNDAVVKNDLSHTNSLTEEVLCCALVYLFRSLRFFHLHICTLSRRLCSVG